jgi:hypothetical protein
MHWKLTSLFFTKLLLVTASLVAQQENVALGDTLPQSTKYGLRIGADLAKPVRTLVEDGYSGFELVGDFRFSESFYAAGEIGFEEKEYDEVNLESVTTGSYLKLGVDYNAYNNWFGLNNALFGGLRVGASTFSQERVSYGVYTANPTFPPVLNRESKKFDGLNATWLELMVGVKTEVLNNLYLSINLQLKRMVSEKTPENFDNLYVPGFNRTYDFSEFGVGYGYTISYLIPFFRK